MPKKRVDRKGFPLQPPVPGPDIAGHTVEHCVSTYTVIIDGILLHFSPTDYRLMMLILRSVADNKSFVPFAELMQCFGNEQDNLRRSVYRHLNDMRPRLWQFGFDIVNVRELGYALVHRVPGVPDAATG